MDRLSDLQTFFSSAVAGNTVSQVRNWKVETKHLTIWLLLFIFRKRTFGSRVISCVKLFQIVVNHFEEDIQSSCDISGAFQQEGSCISDSSLFAEFETRVQWIIV